MDGGIIFDEDEGNTLIEDEVVVDAAEFIVFIDTTSSFGFFRTMSDSAFILFASPSIAFPRTNSFFSMSGQIMSSIVFLARR